MLQQNFSSCPKGVQAFMLQELLVSEAVSHHVQQIQWGATQGKVRG